jgi:hypothetical protein
MNSSKIAPQVEPARHWINGQWIGSSAVANSISPSTAEVLGQYSAGGRTEAASAIAAANDYPYEDYAEGGEFIDTVPIGESDRRKIAYDNAKALYKL